MSLRIRKDGRILCAAIHPEEHGDTYLDDGIHYDLSVIRKVLVTEPHEQHQVNGEWWWKGQMPIDREMDDFYLSPCPHK